MRLQDSESQKIILDDEEKDDDTPWVKQTHGKHSGD
jgi:hypothetical protein